MKYALEDLDYVDDLYREKYQDMVDHLENFTTVRVLWSILGFNTEQNGLLSKNWQKCGKPHKLPSKLLVGWQWLKIQLNSMEKNDLKIVFGLDGDK